MSSDKFIKVFDQWVHPDFKLVEQESGGCFLIYLNIAATELMSCFLCFDKTPDEVAEEYNRQVDIALFQEQKFLADKMDSYYKSKSQCEVKNDNLETMQKMQ